MKSKLYERVIMLVNKCDQNIDENRVSSIYLSALAHTLRDIVAEPDESHGKVISLIKDVVVKDVEAKISNPEAVMSDIRRSQEMACLQEIVFILESL